MRVKYNKTNWVDNETPINADNMNKIEGAIENLYTLAMSPSDFATNGQIKPSISQEGISLDFNGIVLREADTRPAGSNSKGTPGDFYVDYTESPELYICLFPNRWIKLTAEWFGVANDND